MQPSESLIEIHSDCAQFDSLMQVSGTNVMIQASTAVRMIISGTKMVNGRQARANISSVL